MQGCQMLDKEYGKCLSSLWQIFGKKIWKWQCHWQHRFTNTSFCCNSYFFHTFHFLKFNNCKKICFNKSKDAYSVGKINSLLCLELDDSHWLLSAKWFLLIPSWKPKVLIQFKAQHCTLTRPSRSWTVIKIIFHND